MNGGVVVPEGLFAAFQPNSIEVAKSLADETVEVRIGAFLGATFDNHVDELDLGALCDKHDN